MVKKLMMMTMLLTLLASTTLVFAEDVYITANGERYHHKVCRFTKNRDVEKIDAKEAKDLELTPCRWCFKMEKETKK